ncbi:MAG TPA: hypothetical protein PKM70_10885 [Clostridia bacterium]|nr:hypothetical protein [Clostridia bacterium]
MHQLVAWVVAIWMFLMIALTGINTINEGFLKRDEKRNLNLLGREIVNCISFDDGNLVLDRDKCFESVKALPTSQNVKVMIFVYEDVVAGMTESESETVYVEDDERSVCVNRVLNMLIDKAARIEIAYNGVEDSFFNELGDGIYVFLVSEHESFFSVSGFSLYI